ncbi:MAG: Gfo/Idh/MocA family oxidoreductase [Verrucomicrobia bacterium]|nr:Gfo/Idh/MocA family oxidoreductase [Verrucomicrobiota bacterium]
MAKFKVMVVGMGKRGKSHACHFHANENFEVVGICDIDEAKCAEVAPGLGDPKTGTEAARMADELKPEVFCFCTLPHIRAEMIQIGVACGARLIAFEKPVALTSDEGLRIKQMLSTSEAKVMVSHQHRYGRHYQAVKEVIASGKIGRVHTVYGSAHGWAAHMLSHLIDYSMWFNDYARAEWVMAQAAGKHKLADLHASPDYIAGFVQFENGVRGIYECGGGAPDVPAVERWWGKNKMGAIGTEGYAEVYTGNGWKAVTRDGLLAGEGTMNYDTDMPGYIHDMAEWLKHGKASDCSFANAYAGFEIMLGMFRSAALGGQVAMPLELGENELDLLRNRMSDGKLLVTLDASKQEFAC